LQNQPLSSNEQAKLLIFTLLLAPTIFFLVGIIPAIFLAFGIYMMKKNQDFSSIDTAVKNFKWYVLFILLCCILSSLYWGNMYFNQEDSYINSSQRYIPYHRYDDEFFFSLAFSAIAFGYFIAVEFLFYRPLKKHSKWVATNGIFSAKSKSGTNPDIESEMDIIKGEKLKQYSVADELIKWAKLKEEGHITEEEFNQVRAKLLKRN